MAVAISYTVDTSEAKDGLENLKRLNGIKEGMQEAGLFLLNEQKEYPPESHRKLPFGFVSDKQRRAFFAMLRSGEIQVPYSRTMGLQRSFAMQTEADGLIVRTGTNVPSAEWTHGERQALYHRITGWRQVKVIGQQMGGEAFMIVYRAAQREYE